MKKLNKKGFTLIELIAVIVILSIILLIGLIAFDYVLIKNFIKLLMIL